MTFYSHISLRMTDELVSWFENQSVCLSRVGWRTLHVDSREEEEEARYVFAHFCMFCANAAPPFSPPSPDPIACRSRMEKRSQPQDAPQQQTIRALIEGLEIEG